MSAHILHLRSSAGLYGAEYVVLGLVPALARLGIGSTLLCIDNPYLSSQPLPDRARALGIACERLPCRGRFDMKTVAALRRRIEATPGAIVHVHDYKSALIAFFARGRRAIPIVSTAHGQFSSSARLHVYHRLELSLMRRFDFVCAVSEDMRPQLRRAGIRDERIRLIENGVDTERFGPGVDALPRSELGIRDDAVLYGSAIRLTEQKNPLALIDAFAQVVRAVPNAALAIAGDGPLRAAMENRIAALRLTDRVRLLGARADLERFYATLDVFVLASLYEGLPLALLEAMAMERPLVATAVGQVPAVLAGLDVATIAPGDVDALAESMIRAATSRQRTADLRRRVIERYSVARMAADYAAVYAQTQEARHARAA